MLVRYVRFGLHGTALVLVAAFTFGLLLAYRAGLAGVFLGLLLISWFFKYCFVVMDAALAGHDEPPVLSVEMVNPVSEARPLFAVAWIGAAISAVLAVHGHWGQGAAFTTAIALACALPASLGILGLESNPLLAASPLRWLMVIRALRWHYLPLLAAMLAAAALPYVLTAQGYLPLAVICGQMLLLVLFALIGGALFEHRLDLGLDSRTRQERTAERDRREHLAARQHMIDHAYEQFRINRPKEGWREIETWLAAHARGTRSREEYHAVLEAACSWDDGRPADRLANDLIGLLLATSDNGTALEVAELRLASNPKFTPAQAPRLAELAGLAGKPALRRKLQS
jgi:hypothetical protein